MPSGQATTSWACLTQLRVRERFVWSHLADMALAAYATALKNNGGVGHGCKIAEQHYAALGGGDRLDGSDLLLVDTVDSCT